MAGTFQSGAPGRYDTRLERLVKDTLSSLFGGVVSDEEKSFKALPPEANVIKLFTALSYEAWAFVPSKPF